MENKKQIKKGQKFKKITDGNVVIVNETRVSKGQGVIGIDNKGKKIISKDTIIVDYDRLTPIEIENRKYRNFAKPIHVFNSFYKPCN